MLSYVPYDDDVAIQFNSITNVFLELIVVK